MATKSVGLVGRDFSTLAAWATYVNALTLTGPEVCEIYNDGGPVVDTVPVTIGGWTGGSATNTVTIRPAAGHGFKDHATAATNPLRLDATKGATLSNTLSGSTSGAYRVTGGYCNVDGLQIRSTVACCVIRLAVAATSAVRNSIIEGQGGYPAAQSDGAPESFDNCVIIQKGDGIGYQAFGAGSSGANQVNGCTIARIGSGSTASGLVISAGGTPAVTNTVVYGFASSFDGGPYHANSKNNATSQATFSGANSGTAGQVNVTSVDFVSVTSGSEDLRPASGSTKLLNTGATFGIASDILGTARPQGAAYDIGAVEYVVAAGDATPPTLTGSIASSAITQTSYTLAWPTGADNVAVTAYEYNLNGGAFVSTGTATTVNITGRTAGSTDTVTVRAKDAAGNVSTPVLSTTVNLLAAVLPSITTPVLKNNTGTVLASETGVVVNVYNASSGALVLQKSGLTSNASGIVTFTDVALSASTSYAYEVVLSGGRRRLPLVTTA